MICCSPHKRNYAMPIIKNNYYKLVKQNQSVTTVLYVAYNRQQNYPMASSDKPFPYQTIIINGYDLRHQAINLKEQEVHCSESEIYIIGEKRWGGHAFRH